MRELGDAISGAENVGGIPYRVIRTYRAVYPRRVGTIALPVARFQFYEARSHSSSQDMLDRLARDPFFAFSARQQASVKTPTVKITAVALPKKDRPSNFSGLVGEVKLRIEEPPPATDIKPGDSIALNAVIVTDADLAGDLNFEWPADRKFKFYIDQPEDGFYINDNKQPILFHQRTLKSAIVPLEAGPLTIGPIAISYFDPASKTYKRASSNQVTIDVGAGASLLPTTAQGENFGRGSGSRRLTSDILPNHLGSRVRGNHAFDFSLLYLALLLLPPAFSLWLSQHSKGHQQRKQTQKIRSAGKRALNKLRKIDSSSDQVEVVYRIFSDFLRERFELPSGVIGADQLRETLKTATLNNDTIESLCNRLEMIEALRYGSPTSEAKQETINATKEVIRAAS